MAPAFARGCAGILGPGSLPAEPDPVGTRVRRSPERRGEAQRRRRRRLPDARPGASRSWSTSRLTRSSRARSIGPALFPGVIAVGLIALRADSLVRRGVREGRPLVAFASWMRDRVARHATSSRSARRSSSTSPRAERSDSSRPPLALPASRCSSSCGCACSRRSSSRSPRRSSSTRCSTSCCACRLPWGVLEPVLW